MYFLSVSFFSCLSFWLSVSLSLPVGTRVCQPALVFAEDTRDVQDTRACPGHLWLSGTPVLVQGTRACPEHSWLFKTLVLVSALLFWWLGMMRWDCWMAFMLLFSFLFWWWMSWVEWKVFWVCIFIVDGHRWFVPCLPKRCISFLSLSGLDVMGRDDRGTVWSFCFLLLVCWDVMGFGIDGFCSGLAFFAFLFLVGCHGSGWTPSRVCVVIIDR